MRLKRIKILRIKSKLRDKLEILREYSQICFKNKENKDYFFYVALKRRRNYGHKAFK